MELYKNLAGNSGITAYEIGNNWIKVEFSDRTIYRYSYSSAGVRQIEEMKTLARMGQGLHTFINESAKNKYEVRLR